MKHLRRFNESIGDIDTNELTPEDKIAPEFNEDDEIIEIALESDMTTELMEVIRPFYMENGAEKTKKYLSIILESFDDENFVDEYYSLPQ